MMEFNLNISTFFAGAGGLDLGFSKAGFNVQWANEYDKTIWDTYRLNHKGTILDTRSITDIDANEVPDCDGIIGGPPCQSWSEAGALRGINDHRGQLFFDFIRILKEKQPKFFLAENVSGMLSSRHSEALENIQNLFRECGYKLSFKLLNAQDYGVPQTRKRVFFVGFRDDLNKEFIFPEPTHSDNPLTLKDAIYDLKDSAVPCKEKNYTAKEDCKVLNHEYMIGGWSPIFLSRNRVRTWDECSFTIQAGGRQAPLHPQAPVMPKIEKNKHIFKPGYEDLYRRLSLRECARIQTFPDDFEFIYTNTTAGYKMVGNAVPVELGRVLAESIMKQLSN